MALGTPGSVRVERNRISVVLAYERQLLGTTAAVTAMLMLATLFFTDWGIEMPHPVVQIAWPHLVAACIAEVAAIIMWLLSVPPTIRDLPANARAANTPHPQSPPPAGSTSGPRVE